MDCDGVRAAGAAELDKSLQDLPSLSRPLVVEARIDPAQYDSQFSG
jgi:acetolactate synthase-1/2/3 large subunit